AADGGLAIDVSDSGVGISPESLELIFEPFRQADGAQQRPHGGVGLGLYIVRRLLEVLNGKVSVDSVVGVGSAFHVFVPDAAGRAIEDDGTSLTLTSAETNVAVIRRDGRIVAVND